VTVAAVLLLVGGTLLELVALDGARRDLRDVAQAGADRKASLPSTMAPSKHVVSSWISDVTRTRSWGIWCFGAGLVAQALGNLAALA
jgi:hypothetical protein